MAALPSSSVTVLNTMGSTQGAAGIATTIQKLEETNLLLRALVILMCQMNDVNYDDVITLASNPGSVLGLQA